MDMFDAMHKMILEGSAPDDYFDVLRTITDMTGHRPFGFIWLDVDNYAPDKPGDPGLFKVEWLPFEPETPREDTISVLETLLTTIKNNQERRYSDE
jgi:hypothetical protein